MAYVLVGCRSVIVLVFVISAVSKLRSRQAYSEFVAATGRLSPRPMAAMTARRLAAAVVAGEVAVVALVLVPMTVPLGFAIATALLVAFTGAILVALRRGVRTPCRCFGSAAQPLGYAQVVRNAVLLVVAATGVLAGFSWPATPELAGTLIAVAAGAVVATPVIIADDIAALFRPG